MLKEEVIMKKNMKVITSAMAAVMTASVLASTASAYSVQPPMHNQYGQPVYYNVRLVQPINYSSNVPLSVPTNLGSFRLTSRRAVSRNISEAIYQVGGRQITLRKARGTTGISNNYPGTYRCNINGYTVTFKGNMKGYYTATWSRGGYNYIVKSKTALNMTQMTNTVRTLINA